MENFKPKSLSEMNAEFARKLAQQMEEKQKVEEEQKLSEPSTDTETEATLENAFELEEDDSMMFDGFDFSALDDIDDDAEDTAETQEENQDKPAEKSVNLFEDIKLPVFEKKDEQKEEAEPIEAEEISEPDPKGFFGPPVEKSYKKEKEQKIKAEPKFDFEKADDYSSKQLKKALKPKKKKSKAAKGLLNAAIIVVVIFSLIVGLASFATAQPGRFLFGKGLLICEDTIEQTDIAEGTLLFVKAAASAQEDDIVAVYKDSMSEYKFIQAKEVSFKDTVFAVAEKQIPQVGKFISFVTSKWIIFAAAAAALIIILVIIRIVAFRRDKDLIIGEAPKRRGKSRF